MGNVFANMGNPSKMRSGASDEVFALKILTSTLPPLTPPHFPYSGSVRLGRLLLAACPDCQYINQNRPMIHLLSKRAILIDNVDSPNISY